MPNWCDTTVTITCKKEEDAEKLGNLLKEWTSRDYSENGFGLNWLGNVAGNSGIATWDDEKNAMIDNEGDNLFVRGSLDEFRAEGNNVYLYITSAWTPAIRMWFLIADKYIGEHEFTYIAEEPGCGLYSTNDPWYVGTYRVDYWEMPEEFRGKCNLQDEYSVSEEELVPELQKLLETKEDDVKKLIEEADEKFDDWLYIHEWTDDDPSIFD